MWDDHQFNIFTMLMREKEMCKENCVLCNIVLEWDDNDYTIKDEDYIYNQCYHCDEIFCIPCSVKNFQKFKDLLGRYADEACSKCFQNWK